MRSGKDLSRVEHPAESVNVCGVAHAVASTSKGAASSKVRRSSVKSRQDSRDTSDICGVLKERAAMTQASAPVKFILGKVDIGAEGDMLIAQNTARLGI